MWRDPAGGLIEQPHIAADREAVRCKRTGVFSPPPRRSPYYAEHRSKEPVSAAPASVAEPLSPSAMRRREMLALQAGSDVFSSDQRWYRLSVTLF